MAKIWEIKLLVESDDEAEIERIGDEVARAACAEEPASDHACRVPWFLVTTPLPDDDASGWRDELNR